MRPPLNRKHVESVHTVASRNAYITWSCSCGARGTPRKLASIPIGQPTIARLMADELNAHRLTYVAAAPARQGGTPSRR